MDSAAYAVCEHTPEGVAEESFAMSCVREYVACLARISSTMYR